MQFSLIQTLGKLGEHSRSVGKPLSCALRFPNATCVLPTSHVFRWGYITRKHVIYQYFLGVMSGNENMMLQQEAVQLALYCWTRRARLSTLPTSEILDSWSSDKELSCISLLSNSTTLTLPTKWHCHPLTRKGTSFKTGMPMKLKNK